MNISWTRFSSFNTCTLKYHLYYQKKVRLPRPVLRFAPGLAVHSVMEEWAKLGFVKGFVTKDVLHKYLRLHLSSAKSVSPRQYRGLYEKVAKAVVESAKVYGAVGIPQHRISVEPRVTLPIDDRGNNLIGGWDVFDLDTGTIYDLKVTTTASLGDVGQLETYAVAAKIQGYAVKAGAFIMPLLKKSLRRHDFSREVLERRHQSLSQAAMAMTVGVKPVPTPGQHCWLCDYNNTSHCPATFKQVRSFTGGS